MIVVLTDQLDMTADMVVAELGRRQVPVFRADTAEFPQCLDLEAWCEGAGWSGSLRTAHRQVALSDITAVYYRRPTRFALAEGMSGPERKWAYEEARFGFGGVLVSLPCRWVPGPPHLIAAAEYKPVQLQAAAAAGLAVPRTLITNVPARAEQFAASCPNGIVYKPLGGGPVAEDGQVSSIYTTVVDRKDWGNPGIARTAHQFQEWVPKQFEVRLTVVGARLFAARIDASSDTARVDWRADYDALTYTVVDTPEDVAAGVLRLLDRLGLRFGAIDFVVTPGGDWVFLEINPNGQWAWIESETGLPIAAAIADELTERQR